MGYLTFIIALGIIYLFGTWSSGRRRRALSTKKTKIPEVISFSKSNGQTKLRRIK